MEWCPAELEERSGMAKWGYRLAVAWHYTKKWTIGHGMVLALVRKTVRPLRRESIIPEACWMGPLLGTQNHLFEQGQRGVVVERIEDLYAWYTVSQMSGGIYAHCRSHC